MIYKGLSDKITAAGGRMLSAILDRHRQAGQVATGKTSAMLRIVPTENGFQLRGWRYAGSYEEGRAPGRMPPVSAIEAWARAKGLTFSTPRQARSWAFAVARKIGRQGTRRYRAAIAGTPTDIFATPLEDAKKEIRTECSAFYYEEIKRTLLRGD